jgi:hypothetical protein
MKLKLNKKRRHSALTLLGGLIIFGVILVFGFILIKILLKTLENLPPIQRSGDDTNIVAVTSVPFYSVPIKVEMPGFSFSPSDLATLNAEEFSVSGTLIIERSTNLIDWQPAWRISATSEFSFAGDTNGLSLPKCFYRAVIVP